MSERSCSAREKDVVVVVSVATKWQLETDVKVVENATGSGKGEIGQPDVGSTALKRYSAVHPARQVGKKTGYDWEEAVKIIKINVDIEGEGIRTRDPQLGLSLDSGDGAGGVGDDDELPYTGGRETGVSP